MYTEIRWQQRWQNFSKAYLLLQRIVQQDSRSEAEQMGLIQCFEMCFELSWKLMKDYLELEGYQIKGPRDTIKHALQNNLIQNGRIWLEALENRNNTVHTYNAKIAQAIEYKIVHDYSKMFTEIYSLFKDKINEEK